MHSGALEVGPAQHSCPGDSWNYAWMCPQPSPAGLGTQSPESLESDPNLFLPFSSFPNMLSSAGGWCDSYVGKGWISTEQRPEFPTALGQCVRTKNI